MLAMTLLGVGTGLPDADRENTHMVWQAPDGLLLIDSGGSTWTRLLRAGFDPLQLRGIVLTHGHPDHINGFPVLLFQLFLAGFRAEMPVYGNATTLEHAQRIVEAFAMSSYSAQPAWHVVQPGDDLPLNSAFYRVRTAETVHSKPALALRFESPSGQALVYPADTEPCPAVAALAQGAQILIHEATTPEPFEGHTSPRQVGEIALQAAVQQVVLVHFSPRYTMPVDQALTEVRAGGFAGAVAVGNEFERYELA
jgi:ribonuclease Z